ncbi:MAG: hypothetical protein F6K65_30460 [Moorea sp. SIO3C2]|nr:hypothetical protein [Moorena sp. SIO3C2]
MVYFEGDRPFDRPRSIPFRVKRLNVAEPTSRGLTEALSGLWGCDRA